MGMTLKRVLAVVLTLFVFTGGAVVVAAPASAVGGYCDARIYGYAPVENSSGNFHCYQNTGTYYASATTGIQKSYNVCYAQPRGWSTIAVDGVYGSQTAQAVKNVQGIYGLTKDGKYGPQTASQFRSYVNNVNDGWTCKIAQH